MADLLSPPGKKFRTTNKVAKLAAAAVPTASAIGVNQNKNAGSLHLYRSDGTVRLPVAGKFKIHRLTPLSGD